MHASTHLHMWTQTAGSCYWWMPAFFFPRTCLQVTEAVVLFLDYYMAKTLRNAATYHTEASLAEVDRRLQLLVAHLLAWVPQTSHWQLIKLHLQSHVTRSIRALGPPRCAP